MNFNRFKQIKVRKWGEFLAIFLLAVILAIVIGSLIIQANPDYVSDSFTDESKIGKGTERVEISTSTGQVKLAECYIASPSWDFSTTTIVRDITSTSSDATTTKDIYCDDENCILYTYNQVPPAQVCIATDPNVYANILWSKTDSGTASWGPASNVIIGDDIGGTHPAGLLVGSNGENVGGKNWLERYYGSASGTYPAMDLCKNKGSGWRLPTILELDSIRDMTKETSPYTRMNFSGYYWSSSENLSNKVYFLGFSNGYAYYSGEKSTSYNVRCVRGW